jgi:outer membrane lipoprotein SlyB
MSFAGPANSVVTLIEIVPRQSADVGTGSMAGAAVGGTTNSGSSDHVYRITVRMDDGSTKSVTQEGAPTFKSGDRVRVANGVVQSQR